MPTKNINNAGLVCIVDAYSTGKKLVSEFLKFGTICIHIKSSQKNALDPRRPEFYEEIQFDGNIHELQKTIKQFSPQHIIAGSEMGVELADKLIDNLNIRNACNPKTTHYRRNKYAMHECLRKNNLSSIQQLKSDNKNKIVEWCLNLKKWPVVIKPLNSAASDGVTICETIDEVKTAIEKILKQENRLGIKNEEILAQEFLDGTQYFVNTVSWNGEHFISDIWIQKRKRLPGKAFLFESMALCDREGQIEEHLAKYTIEILNTLQLTHGAAHNEIMWTEKGPVLIELNARLMGGAIEDSSFKSALGYTQAELLAIAYLDSNTFLKKYANKKYNLKNNLTEISFLFSKNGTLKNFTKKHAIEKMESFHSFYGLPPPGTQVIKTEDTLGNPGYVYLLHQNNHVINKNLNQILEWQNNDEIFIID